MRDQITRRDFINGMAIAAVGTLASKSSGADPRVELPASPPQRTGLRGSHLGSFEVAHALRDGRRFDELPSATERADVVIVGGGLSGLAAAHEYRKHEPTARILILETNDDFGGHAKRNEFEVDGRTLIGYGGTQSIDSPRRRYRGSPAVMLKELGVDLSRFEKDFDREFYEHRGMRRGIFFKKESFGIDKLVVQPFGRWDDYVDRPASKESIADFLGGFPITSRAKNQLLEMYTSDRNVLARYSASEQTAILQKTSYRDFLKRYWDADEDVLKVLQSRTNGLWAVGIDAVSAANALDLPGFHGIKAPGDFHSEGEEPYIYHFPDGNASLARLLVRKLIPGFAPGSTMDDIVTANGNYAALDVPSNACSIRLLSTAVSVRNVSAGVTVQYIRNGQPYEVQAKGCILACYQAMMPYLVPELGRQQREALSQNVRAPLVYATLAARNWRAWEQLGVAAITNPGGTYDASLDFPVSMGVYHFSADASQPICIHLEHEPCLPASGLSMREQFRAGRGRLYGMTFGDFEAEMRDELGRMLGPGGFEFDRDIAAITVNRWPHGYSYTADSLWDDPATTAKTMALARARLGRITIANSDSGWDAYTDVAMREAHRAVHELLS